MNSLFPQFQGKKGAAGAIISAFIVMLILVVILGMTFLFTASFKTQVQTIDTAGTAGTAYRAINQTEAGGFSLVGFVPIVLLALIFTGLLAFVIRQISPYLNLGGGGL